MGRRVVVASEVNQASLMVIGEPRGRRRGEKEKRPVRFGVAGVGRV